MEPAGPPILKWVTK